MTMFERLAHLDRASASGAEGGRFEPGIAHFCSIPGTRVPAALNAAPAFKPKRCCSQSALQGLYCLLRPRRLPMRLSMYKRKGKTGIAAWFGRELHGLKKVARLSRRPGYLVGPWSLIDGLGRHPCFCSSYRKRRPLPCCHHLEDRPKFFA
jgi:hypothetical protein